MGPVGTTTASGTAADTTPLAADGVLELLRELIGTGSDVDIAATVATAANRDIGDVWAVVVGYINGTVPGPVERDDLEVGLLCAVLAQHPHTPISVLEAIVERYRAVATPGIDGNALLRFVAEHRNCSTELLTRLASDPTDRGQEGIWAAVAKNPATDASTMRHIARKTTAARTLASLARREDLPADIAELLAEAGDDSVLKPLLANPTLPVELAARFAAGPRRNHRAWVVSNPNLPSSVLVSLIDDLAEEVRAGAWDALRRRGHITITL